MSKIEFLQKALRLNRTTVTTMVQEKYANDFRCVTNMQINHFRTLKMYLPCFNAITTTLNSIQKYSSQNHLLRNKTLFG